MAKTGNIVKRTFLVALVSFVISAPFYVLATYLVSAFNQIGQISWETLPLVFRYFIARFSLEACLTAHNVYFLQAFVIALFLAFLALRNRALRVLPTMLLVFIILAACFIFKSLMVSKIPSLAVFLYYAPIWLVCALLIWFGLAIFRLNRS